MATRKDLYTTLGIPKGATQEDIRKAYRALARRFHPDRNIDDPDSESRFREVTEAYEVLSDPEKRKQYDVLGPLYHPQGKAPSAEDLGAFFSGTISSIFTKRGPNAQGENIEYNLQLQLEDVLGATKVLSVRREVECTNCNGTGADGEAGKQTCQACNGTGKSSGKIFRSQCARCGGKGYTISKRCNVCGGLGRVDNVEEISLTIPKGIQAGQKLRLKGKGHASHGSGTAGDLFVVITIDSHPLFERQGRDLYCEVPLLWTEALLGTDLEIPTLSSNTKIRIPAGTTSHKIFRLTGRGLPDPKGNGMGDLHVRVIIEFPASLSPAQRREIESFSRKIDSSKYPNRQQFDIEIQKRGLR